jgi:starch synthase (maltosyl-transferring)
VSTPRGRGIARSAVDGRLRTVIENVTPQVDAGRFAVKRTVGDAVHVETDAFTDGHDAVRCLLRYRHEEQGDWSEVEMQALGNDRWAGSFTVSELGRYRYTVVAWTDRYLTWRRELERRDDPADILVALKIGAELLASAAGRASGEHRSILDSAASELAEASDPLIGQQRALEEELHRIALRYPDRGFETHYDRELTVVVDPVHARFSSWYELFPRSTSRDPERHGTFADCEAQLPYIARLGFDVLYLPPIHPIGRMRRKGPNNALEAGPDDLGSPWAIGASEGGHCAIHPALGTFADFERLVARATEHGIRIALDIAFQCAPDHPYVAEHPEWFRVRPDGTVQYAENPPKKYQDIFPFDFESPQWAELHAELTRIVEFWVRKGVRVFRVDNPHTKPFGLWETLIATVKSAQPDVIFLSEAFTRPKVMHRLAKIGFSQSYTYFTWRNTRSELENYFTELCQGPGREYFRPNVWPNTPDILPEYLQVGGRAAFMTRIVLAATLSASYGIYGPAFELGEHRPRAPGSEEYLDSEKYQRRLWDLEREDSLASFITRLNRIRREQPALQQDWELEFLALDNPQMLAYMKTAGTDAVVVVVNLDPHNLHSGWLEMPLERLGLQANSSYRMQDLLGGGNYLWQGARNFVALDPQGVVAHVFVVRRQLRTEREFDYFM